ncbi:TPA: HAD hydrolase-like protein [Candidatus Woesearchaeota archaeon]|nr:HAD hydrolase-like protein [Candidatus Woesearchaeota archaeon]
MLKVAIFDLDLCCIDTYSQGEDILDPVLKVARESAPLDGSKLESLRRELMQENFDTVMNRYTLPSTTVSCMRSAYARLVAPPSTSTYGDMDALEALDMKRYLVSTGFYRFQMSKIHITGILPYFEAVLIDSLDNLSARKGKLDIFRAIRLHEGVASQDVVVIGDNPRSELAAAKTLGMRTVQSVRPGVRREDGFDAYILSFDALVNVRKHMDRLNQQLLRGDHAESYEVQYARLE